MLFLQIKNFKFKHLPQKTKQMKQKPKKSEFQELSKQWESVWNLGERQPQNQTKKKDEHILDFKNKKTSKFENNEATIDLNETLAFKKQLRDTSSQFQFHATTDKNNLKIVSLCGQQDQESKKQPNSIQDTSSQLQFHATTDNNNLKIVSLCGQQDQRSNEKFAFKTPTGRNNAKNQRKKLQKKRVIAKNVPEIAEEILSECENEVFHSPPSQNQMEQQPPQVVLPIGSKKKHEKELNTKRYSIPLQQQKRQDRYNKAQLPVDMIAVDTAKCRLCGKRFVGTKIRNIRRHLEKDLCKKRRGETKPQISHIVGIPPKMQKVLAPTSQILSMVQNGTLKESQFKNCPKFLPFIKSMTTILSAVKNNEIICQPFYGNSILKNIWFHFKQLIKNTTQIYQNQINQKMFQFLNYLQTLSVVDRNEIQGYFMSGPDFDEDFRNFLERSLPDDLKLPNPDLQMVFPQRQQFLVGNKSSFEGKRLFDHLPEFCQGEGEKIVNLEPLESYSFRSKIAQKLRMKNDAEMEKWMDISQINDNRVCKICTNAQIGFPILTCFFCENSATQKALQS